MHEIKTLGWTISEWQTAYSKNEIQLNTLKDLVALIDPQDNAWISIATLEQIEQQIQVLNELTKKLKV
jgi:allophanate hydrolase